MLRDLPKDDIPLIVLAVLTGGSYHSHGIAREIERISEERLRIKTITLYPALRRLELDGMVAGKWELQPVGPARKIYSLTEKGQEELERRTREWRAYAALMRMVLSATGDEDSER